jgi:hypothetical protein
MTAAPDTIGASRLAKLARRSADERVTVQERCDLCGVPIPDAHRHLLDLATRELRCTCRACSLLFDREAAARDHYKLVPDRRLRLDDFVLDDALWEELHIPVDMAFFYDDSSAGRVAAFYPSPMGATESLLELSAWAELEERNPVLRDMQPDVEALLVNRARGARSHWLVPIDECFSLVGLIRTNWRGLTGGREVWDKLGRFFERLDGRARPAARHGNRKES